LIILVKRSDIKSRGQDYGYDYAFEKIKFERIERETLRQRVLIVA